MNKNIRIENRIILIVVLIAMIGVMTGIGTSSVYAYVETNVTVETPVPTTNVTVETPVPVQCNEYVAAHPEIYPISSCQQIVSSWSNSITNDENVYVTVNVDTNVRFGIVTSSDFKSTNVVIEPSDIIPYNIDAGIQRYLWSDVIFDKVGHYNVNLAASNSFARGGVTWSVDVIDTVYIPTPTATAPAPTPAPTMTAVATPVTMDDNSRNELNKLDSDGIKYVLISIRDFAFNPDIIYVEPNVAVFIFNEDTKTHYVKFGLNNEYHGVRSGTIFSFCCGNDEVVVEYEDRDYIGMKGKIVVRSTQINPPSGVPGGKINGYDKIYGWHEIILCNPVSDAERLVTDLTEKNCGNPDLNIDHYPLDLLPSGGNSGNVSASEMIMAKVKIAGHISLVPWRTQHVKMIWYNESGRIMFVADRDANSFNPEVMSYIGRFSWEINKPGPYYIDIDAGDMGNARVVFNVTGSGVITTPIPTVTVTPIVTATTTATATATATATPIVTYTQTNPPALEVDNPGPGCWNSYIGFGICVGDVATKTGAGILLGIGKGIADMLGW